MQGSKGWWVAHALADGGDQRSPEGGLVVVQRLDVQVGPGRDELLHHTRVALDRRDQQQRPAVPVQRLVDQLPAARTRQPFELAQRRQQLRLAEGRDIPWDHRQPGQREPDPGQRARALQGPRGKGTVFFNKKKATAETWCAAIDECKGGAATSSWSGRKNSAGVGSYSPLQPLTPAGASSEASSRAAAAVVAAMYPRSRKSRKWRGYF